MTYHGSKSKYQVQQGHNLANMLRSDSTAEMALDILENLEDWTPDLLPAIRELESAWRRITAKTRMMSIGDLDPWTWERVDALRTKAYAKKILSEAEYYCQWDRPTRFNSYYQTQNPSN